MQILGITGGTGGGKTTFLNEARKRGALVLDCDEIYHELLISNKTMLDEIENRFPGTVINGILDRKKLGKFVFSSPDALLDLNAITHCYVTDEVFARLESAKEYPFAVIDAIALIESGLSHLCTITVAICAPYGQRIARLMAREGIDREYAIARIQAQKQDSFFEENCTYTIVNDYPTQEAFADAVNAFLNKILVG